MRGLVVGLGLALAYRANLAAYDGGARFLAMAAIGALCYGGVDLAFDAGSVIRGERRKLQSWRLYALGVLLGGLVAGALGWYFDTPQLHVVIDKFWAYADVNYRLDGRKLGDFTTYPIFNKYGLDQSRRGRGRRQAVLDRVGGGRHQLVARRAAVLDQLRSARRGAAEKLASDQDAAQPGRRRRPGGAGGARVALGLVDGAGHQLVPAPVAGPDLVQSGWRDPHGRRHRRERDPEPGGLPPVQPARCSPAFSPTTGSESSSGSTIWGSGSRPWSICRFSAATAPTRRRRDSSATMAARAPFRTASAALAPGRRCSFRFTSRVGLSGTRLGQARRRWRAAARRCRTR